MDSCPLSYGQLSTATGHVHSAPQTDLLNCLFSDAPRGERRSWGGGDVDVAAEAEGAPDVDLQVRLNGCFVLADSCLCLLNGCLCLLNGCSTAACLCA